MGWFGRHPGRQASGGKDSRDAGSKERLNHCITRKNDALLVGEPRFNGDTALATTDQLPPARLVDCCSVPPLQVRITLPPDTLMLRDGWVTAGPAVPTV